MLSSVRYVELKNFVSCGELEWLRACLCQRGADPVARLSMLQRLLADLTERDLKTVARLVCQQCAPTQLPNPSQARNECAQAVATWAKEHSTLLNTVQNLLTVASASGVPGWDQMVSLLLFAVEQLEDAGASPENTWTESVLDGWCKAAATLEAARRSLVGQLPDVLAPVADMLTKINPTRLIAMGCCSGMTLPPASSTPQLPPSTQGETPQLPPSATTPTGTVPVNYPTAPPVYTPPPTPPQYPAPPTPPPNPTGCGRPTNVPVT